METPDLIAFLVYLCCFPLYHTGYLYLTKKSPDSTKKGRINSCIGSWLEEVTEKDQQLLAVHQIRNMIMSVTFLASTSILLMGFLLTYGLTEIPSGNPIALSGIDYPGWLTFFTLTYSFLNLLLALRHLNNLSVLVRADRGKLEEIEGSPPLTYLEKLFVKGSQRYMIGRRGFLYAIVVLFWYVNLWVFIGLIILLTFTLSFNHDF
ncbi:DUF599 domain-containing protein [Candidatus Bipolaricaulota bacterium]|nr:DUF599 domain-containing protein [Candidatus Bipolaricaulota bacterium]